MEEANFAFFLTDPVQLVETERRFVLSAGDIARINPNTQTAPVFRARADAELTARIYARVPVLIDKTKGGSSNPWGLSFMTMFHMSNDSGLFRSAAQLRAAGFEREGSGWAPPEGVRPRQGALDVVGGDDRSLPLAGRGGTRALERYVPLYEAKMVHHFNHRYGDFLNAPGKDGTEYREIPQADAATLADPSYDPTPRYWVPESEVAGRLAAKGWSHRWLMGWRDITNVTNERTVIAATFPRVGVGNNCDGPGSLDSFRGGIS